MTSWVARRPTPGTVGIVMLMVVIQTVEGPADDPLKKLVMVDNVFDIVLTLR